MIGSRRQMCQFAITALIALACSASGQEKFEIRPPDTSFSRRDLHRLESRFFRSTPPFLLTPAKSELDFSMFLRQSLVQVDRTGWEPDQNLATIQWIWRDELDRGSRYDALWNIVGAVEAGAVAYLAYRHLKRYGLK